MFFWNSLSCFFHDPTDVGNLIAGSSAFSKTSLNIWKFTVHILLKPGLENFEHYFTSVWDECNCVVVWTLLLSLLFSCKYFFLNLLRQNSHAIQCTPLKYNAMFFSVFIELFWSFIHVWRNAVDFPVLVFYLAILPVVIPSKQF